MQKFFSQIVVVAALLFGTVGSANALPPCSGICSCQIPCNSACAIGHFATTCGGYGKCPGEGVCISRSAPTPLDALTHFVPDRRISTAGDDEEKQDCDLVLARADAVRADVADARVAR